MKMEHVTIIKSPELVKIQFKPTVELWEFHDPDCGIHTDEDIKDNPGHIYAVSRKDAMRLISNWPNNIKIVKDHPPEGVMVSAVMCTCKGREQFAKRQAQKFNVQTYPHKELVIVNQGDTWVVDNPLPGITEVMVRPELTNGAMHNIGNRLARGQYVVRWDDDDIIASDRIEKQINAIKETGAPASTFANYVNVSLIDGTIREQRAGFCPGLLCHKNEGYQHDETVKRGSDGLFCMEYYYGQIAVIKNVPHKYIRILHGINQIWDRKALFPSTEPGDIEVSAETDMDYVHEAVELFQRETGFQRSLKQGN